MKWICERLSIPVIDVSSCANTPMLWDMRKENLTVRTRRFINDGFHPYGEFDSSGNKSFITAAAMYQGKYIAEIFKVITSVETIKDKTVVDYNDNTGYPTEYND